MGIRDRSICRVAAAAASVVVMALAAAACGSTASGTFASPTPRPGGTFTFPLEVEPVSIEPLNAVDLNGGELIAHQVFQGLARYEPQADGALLAVPDIAEGWTASADLTVWTFRLKHGVTFQSPVSREVTAQDFVDAWNYATDPENLSGMVYILAPIKGTDEWGYAKKGLTGVRALGRYTLRVTLKYPFAEFPQVLGMPVAAVWPVDYLKEIGRQRFRSKPVGTGPYMVAAWRHGKYVDLVRNPGYWEATRAGYLDRIYLPIITAAEEQWREFQKGSIDTMALGRGGGPTVATVEEHPNLKSGTWIARRRPELAVAYLGLNLRSPSLAGDANLPLRQALIRAVDPVTVIEGLQNIPARPTGWVPGGVVGSTLTDLAYPYDAEKAQELAAPYSSFVLRLLYRTDPGYESMARTLQADWERAGIQVAAKEYEAGTLFEELAAGKEDDAFITGWAFDYPSAESFLWQFHSSMSRWFSYTGYSSSRFDGLLSQARATADDKARQRLYAQAEKLLLEDAVVIPLYFYREYRVTDSKVQGPGLSSPALIDMCNVWVQ